MSSSRFLRDRRDLYFRPRMRELVKGRSRSMDSFPADCGMPSLCLANGSTLEPSVSPPPTLGDILLLPCMQLLPHVGIENETGTLEDAPCYARPQKVRRITRIPVSPPVPTDFAFVSHLNDVRGRGCDKCWQIKCTCMSPRRTESETERETKSCEEEEPLLQKNSTPDLAHAEDCKKQVSDLQEASKQL